MSGGLVLLALALAGPAWADPAETPTWERTREVRSDAPVVPDEAWRVDYRDLLAELLRAAPSGRVPAGAATRAASLDLVLERHGAVLWLVEPVGQPRGLGMATIRLGALPTELVLQAPHPYYDEHTGRIAGALFDSGGIRALMLASAQRHAAEDIDPTRQPEGPLTTACDALAQALPDALVVQLHGFGPRRSAAAAVISTGRARSGGDLASRAFPVLARATGEDDLRGPDEVPLLAALNNVQAALLADRVRFLHLEMSASLRAGLAHDALLREQLRQALLALAAREPLP